MKKTAAALMSAAVLLVLCAISPAMAAERKVSLASSLSASTLTIDFKGAEPRSQCAFTLGSGTDVTTLPRATANRRGRGSVSHKLSGDTPRGDQALSATCLRGGEERVGSTFVAIPNDLSRTEGNKAVATGLNIMLDVLLAGALLFFIVLLVQLVVRSTDPRERFLRSLALVCGGIIALGAEATGGSFATYTVDTLTGARPGGEAFKLLSVIIPGGAAAFFSWYFVRVVAEDAMKGLRLMSMLGMLTVIAFAVIFAEATATQGLFLEEAAIPNASFVAGLILSLLVFTPTSDGAVGGGLRLNFLLQALRRSRGSGTPRRRGDEAAAPVAIANPFADD